MIKKVILVSVVLVLSISVGIVLSYYLRKGREDGNPRFRPTNTSDLEVVSQTNVIDIPFSIEALRRREFPGSDFIIERDLGDQGVFKSYVVSYLSDGLKLIALMNVPDAPKPENGWPVIILNHGYIEPTVYDTISSYKSYMDAYSRQGFLVLKPDYRGHDNSEGEPVSAHTSPDYTVDVLNLVSSVKKYPDADPENIGMWGHSMGGGITLRAITVSQDIKAAALLAGVVASPQSFYAYWQQFKDLPSVPSWIKENADKTLKEFGTPETKPQIWAAISPYTYLSDIAGPVQIHHGTSDKDVPIVFSDELNTALKEAGKEVEYFVYPNGDHNLAGSARGPVLSRTYELFNKALKGE